MSTPLGLGMTHGYFSGLADGRSLKNEIPCYYFEMVEKINRSWWEKAGLLKEPLRQDGIFELLIQRDGTIVSIRVLKGTGSREVDRMLSDLIMKTSPLPALPSTFDQDLFRAPLRIKAPSFLFRPGNRGTGIGRHAVNGAALGMYVVGLTRQGPTGDISVGPCRVCCR